MTWCCWLNGMDGGKEVTVLKPAQAKKSVDLVMFVGGNATPTHEKSNTQTVRLQHSMDGYTLVVLHSYMTKRVDRQKEISKLALKHSPMCKNIH